MKSWNKATPKKEGQIEPTRKVSAGGIQGSVRKVGKTSTTLENGASSTASKIGNGFMPKPRGK